MPPKRHVLLVIGDAAEAVRASERALEKGVFAQAIRPPTVPAGSSRLRLTVMACAHEVRAARRRAQVLRGCVRGTPHAVPEVQVFDGLRDAA